ncbi:phage major capsid protein [Mycobacterium sp. 1245499.0]|uniref:phage major capsid protein n=1 Tax=Mycobacterium sp. 1245499.0 TaxID=1834074 RepID=UPI0018D34E3B|nr:phage major capsid protein [Mycobacterium sp. 1245499.0]
MKRTDQAQSFLPEDFGKLLDLVVQEKSVAAKVSTLFSTNKEKAAFPLWVASPTPSWLDELEDIPLTDGDTDEVVVEPKKTISLTLISNELADDSDPDVAQQIAVAAANKLVASIDSAFFNDGSNAKAPAGLLSLVDGSSNPKYQEVDPGTALTNLDPFIEARYAAQEQNASLTHWLVTPATAEALSKLKIASGSNQSLIQFVEDGITVAGLPVVTSTHVDAASTAWGVDKTQLRYVLRQGSTVEKFDSVTNDGLYVRAKSRIGFGFLNPAGVVRIWHDAS